MSPLWLMAETFHSPYTYIINVLENYINQVLNFISFFSRLNC